MPSMYMYSVQVRSSGQQPRIIHYLIITRNSLPLFSLYSLTVTETHWPARVSKQLTDLHCVFRTVGYSHAQSTSMVNDTVVQCLGHCVHLTNRDWLFGVWSRDITVCLSLGRDPPSVSVQWLFPSTARTNVNFY